jgi:hypothetical protein
MTFQCCSALLAEHHVQKEDRRHRLTMQSGQSIIQIDVSDSESTRPRQSLVKLLYILNWMLTSSADECYGDAGLNQVCILFVMIFVLF